MKFITDEQLRSWFGWHPPSTDNIMEGHRFVRDAYHQLAQRMNSLLPEGPDKTVALRALADAAMYANATIARAQALHPDTAAQHPEEKCWRCHGPNLGWSAPSPLWNQVIRSGDINNSEIHNGIVCPTCFAILAEEEGIATHWRLYAERVNTPLQTTTPSGRVWNNETWMFETPEAPHA